MDNKPIETYSEEFIYSRPKSRFERNIDFLSSEQTRFFIVVPLLMLLILPAFTIPTGLVAYIFLKIQATKKGRMPFSFPQTSDVKVDPFNQLPSKGENGEIYYGPADGIAYMGNTTSDNSQVWFGNSKLRQHIAFLAATGSGKTYTITSIACINALLWGAGMLFVDAKADLDIIRMHQSPGWRMNRIDDYFVLNYIQGSRSVWDPYRGDKTTNTYNMLESGTAAQNTETMKSLMQGDGDIWAKRADSLLSSLIGPTTYMRDKSMLTLSVISFLDFLTIENAGALLGNDQIPDLVKKPLMGFIKTLPGMTAQFFEEIKQGNSVKSSQVYDQWGFAAMQIILVLNMLAGDYGRIFGVTVGEIDLEAIVLQDRILLGLLPSLEASSQSVASMGQIIMAARKSVMGRTLGDVVEGSVKANLEQRVTNAPYPFIQVIDEAGMIFSEGEGASAAQARGLGYSLWYSSQDLPAMKKLNDTVAKEVMTVMGNTIIKIAGRIIDDETFEEYSKLFDEEFVWQRDGTEFTISSGGVTATKDSRGSYTKRKRLSKRKVQKLREGEMFISAEDNLYQVNGPNLHPQSLKELMLNDFVPMLPYSQEDIQAYRNEYIFLESEYAAIITESKKLKDVQPPTFTQLPVFSEVLSKIGNFVENDCKASHIAFATFTRLSCEAVSEQINQQDTYYASLEAASRESLGHSSATNENDVDEITLANNKYADEEITADDDSSADAIGLDFSSETSSNDKTGSQQQEEEDNSSLLDSYFKSQGLSKDDLIGSFAQINALTARSDLINKDLKEGSIDRKTADILMNKSVTQSEEIYASVSASKVVQELYKRTDHPGSIRPQQDKAMTLNLLKSVYRELIHSKTEDKLSEEV